jgi:hypothetical protein
MTQTLEGHRVEWESQILAPGEYSKLPDGTWYAATPNDHMANLTAHQVTEHEDGTITVSPSILVSLPAQDGARAVELWHGFLERGVWREC